MDHYSAHELVVLNEERQGLVERMAKKVFRPCCRNSTYFPDCNHGMAMLGLLEILAAQGATEDDLHAVAEKANGLWFPGISGGECGIGAGRPYDRPPQSTVPSVRQNGCGL
jgi:hypothetical protein